MIKRHAITMLYSVLWVLGTIAGLLLVVHIHKVVDYTKPIGSAIPPFAMFYISLVLLCILIATGEACIEELTSKDK